MADNAGGKKRILIVEDEAPIARALVLKLERSGFHPAIAPDGEVALEMLSKEAYDAIVLDLVMPKQDGFSILEKLHENNVQIPILVWSNLGQVEDIRRAKSLGATDYLVKFDTSLVDVVARIKSMLGL